MAAPMRVLIKKDKQETMNKQIIITALLAFVALTMAAQDRLICVDSESRNLRKNNAQRTIVESEKAGLMSNTEAGMPVLRIHFEGEVATVSFIWHDKPSAAPREQRRLIITTNY